MRSKRRTMRAIFTQGLQAAQRDCDPQRIAWYQECLDRMKGAKR